LVISGVIKTTEDIKALADILNNSTSPVGDATADYYRLMEINKKDGSAISLEFGGNDRFFKIVDSGVFFKLEPEDNYKELNTLIDRIEKEYKG
jgi:predicted HAD superfamily phosphohydrolase